MPQVSDTTYCPTTAVVNAANAELMPGGGVAGALHRAAGPGLADECARLAPLRPGECVVTSGHQLPNRYDSLSGACVRPRRAVL